jgi:hypothetical protein
MNHSATLTRPFASPPARWRKASHRDPIVDARSFLHRAGRPSYESALAGRWLRGFRQDVLAARRAVVVHILQAEREDSTLNRIRKEEPRLQGAVGRQFADHDEILRKVHALVDTAMATEDAGIWRVVDLSERARVVTTTLDRHRRRYLELIHERENRVLGGEGG